MHIAIVEDEVAAYNRLCDMVHDIAPHVTIEPQIKSVEGAFTYLETCNKYPDMLLLDLQLNDGLSTHLLPEINENCMVLFTTACEPHTLYWIGNSRFKYLLKPVQKVQLGAMLNMMQVVRQYPEHKNQAMEIFDAAGLHHSRKTHFKTTEDSDRLLSITDICAVKLEGIKTKLITSDGSVYTSLCEFHNIKPYCLQAGLHELTDGCMARLNAISSIVQHDNFIKLKLYADDLYPAQLTAEEFNNWLNRFCTTSVS